MRTSSFLLAGLLVLITQTAGAQTTTPDGGPDPSMVRVRLGPLWMNPTLALTNLGMDDNIFNEPADAPPKRDLTLTLSPQTDLWLRMGRTWLSGNLRQDIVWYKDHASERSGNTSYGVGWRVPLNRLAFGRAAGWASTRERLGVEIDTRPRRDETKYGATVEIRALSRTFIGVNGSWTRTEFETNEFFLGSNLHDELTREGIVAGLALRHQLTPLTSLTFSASRAEDRFEFSPVRDSNSMIYSASITFDASALIRGTASVGYRDFAPRFSTVPGYKGMTTAVDLSYTLFGATRFGGQVTRDVQYSYDVNQPYYLATGVNASVAQQIFGPIDAIGRIGWQRLDYEDRAGASVAVPGRSDYVHTAGGGVGYRMGSTGNMRIGFNIDRQTRTSDMPGRQYEGLRYGTSITYGT